MHDDDDDQKYTQQALREQHNIGTVLFQICYSYINTLFHRCLFASKTF